MLECVAASVCWRLHVGLGVTARPLQSDALRLVRTHVGPLGFILGMTNMSCVSCLRQCVLTQYIVGLKKVPSSTH